jgi:hypothetical protein
MPVPSLLMTCDQLQSRLQSSQTRGESSAPVERPTCAYKFQPIARCQTNSGDAVAPHVALHSSLVPVGYGLSSLSSRALGRPYPRWGPDGYLRSSGSVEGVMSVPDPYSDFQPAPCHALRVDMWR